MDWQKKTVEQAYMMMYTHEVEYRLMNSEKKVEGFSRWQGETGDKYTGQFVIYLEGDESPRILDNDDIVLVHEVEVQPEEDEPESGTDEIAKIYIEENGNLWRIKVFQNTFGVERQQSKRGDNLRFERAKHTDVYNEGLNAWNMKGVDALISHYEATVAEDEDSSTWN